MKPLIFILTIFAYVSYSQTLECMAPTEVDSNSATLLISNKSSVIKKVRVISETLGETSTQETEAGKTYRFIHKLKKGKNRFSVLAYGADGKLIPGENCTQEVVGKSDASNSNAESDSKDKSNKPKETAKPDPPKNEKITFPKVKANSPKPDTPDYDLVYATAPNFKSKYVKGSATNYKIEVENKVGTFVYNPLVKWVESNETSGKFIAKDIQAETIKLKEGDNKVSVTVVATKKEGNKEIKTTFSGTTMIECASPCAHVRRSTNVRSIIGIEQVGASSASGISNPFLDFFVNTPLGKNGLWSMWADFRISSTPQGISSLTDISSNLLGTTIGTTNINSLVQSFSVTGGIDIPVVREGAKIHPFFLPGKTSLSLILGGGITSPLSSSEETTQIFKIPMVPKQAVEGEAVEEGATMVNPLFSSQFAENIDFDGKTNVAFVVPQRDRFLRNWFVGIRLKTRFLKEDHVTPADVSMATFDLRFGQDEEITRTLKNKVLTFEGFTPFPYSSGYLYLYGGAKMSLTRKVNTLVPAVFLERADTFNLSDSNDTQIVSADNNPFVLQNRDKYWFGIGFDVVKVFKKVLTSDEKS